jgi:predicted AAA+ superfamily ATPase
MLLGPRRVGKTAFVQNFLKTQEEKDYLFLNGDDILDAGLLAERSVNNYRRLLGQKSLLVIDEAQHIPDMGMILKVIVDNIEGIRIIATGSSSFNLHQEVGEPLVGRKTTIWMYPLAQMEFAQLQDYKSTIEKREERLIFGGYPELEKYPDWQEKAEYLQQIINDYLLKDILMVDGIRNSSKLFSLLRLIAFQIGKEVSIEELGKQLGMSKNTAEGYLDMLSKVFVVFKIGGWSKNLRKEVSKSSRWYFYDNGIRNAIIQNFKGLDLRMDKGELWKNYLASERIKFQSYNNIYCNNYFWRTYDQQELDWVEEEGDVLRGYEFKFQSGKTVKAPAAWTKAYPESNFQVIHSENYLDWIT